MFRQFLEYCPKEKRVTKFSKLAAGGKSTCPLPSAPFCRFPLPRYLQTAWSALFRVCKSARYCIYYCSRRSVVLFLPNPDSPGPGPLV